MEEYGYIRRASQLRSTEFAAASSGAFRLTAILIQFSRGKSTFLWAESLKPRRVIALQNKTRPFTDEAINYIRSQPQLIYLFPMRLLRIR